MDNYPPAEFLDRVIERCPKAAFVYVKAWREKKDDYTVSFNKKKINTEYFIHTKKFMTDLRDLKKEKILNYSFSHKDDSYEIQFVIPQNTQKVA